MTTNGKAALVKITELLGKAEGAEGEVLHGIIREAADLLGTLESIESPKLAALVQRGFELDADNRISSFSGPIYGDFDRTVEPPGRELAVVGSTGGVIGHGRRTATIEKYLF